MDGTGKLLAPFISRLPSELEPVVVSYPKDEVLSYAQLLPLVEKALSGEGSFVLLGESFSGPLAVMAAAKKPNGLVAVVLVASFVRSPAPWVFRHLRPIVRGFLFHVIPKSLMKCILFGTESSKSFADDFSRTAAEIPPEVFAARIREVIKVDVSSELRQLSVPLLYLAGSRDVIVPARSVDLIRKFCPKVTVVTLDAPHLVLQTTPEESAKAIQSFLHNNEIFLN